MKFHLSLAGTLFAIIALIIVPMVVLGDTTVHSVTGQAWANMPNPNDENKNPDNCHPKYIDDNSNDYGKDGVGCGQGLGWINLNNVTLNSLNGQFSGTAQSQYGGTVNFGIDSSSAPQAPLLSARVDPACLKTSAECPVTGWIKFTQASDGWDGWVKMSGATTTKGSYGVKFLAPDSSGIREMSGYAWGSHVAGWIDFSRVSVVVKIDEPPVVKKQPYCGDPKATPPTGAHYMSPEKVAARLKQLQAQNDGYVWEMVRDDSTCLICPEGTSFDIVKDSCITPPPDVCPNLPNGPYSTVPKGYILVNGQCVKDTTSDYCSNVTGSKGTIISLVENVQISRNPTSRVCSATACKDPSANNYVSQNQTDVKHFNSKLGTGILGNLLIGTDNSSCTYDPICIPPKMEDATGKCCIGPLKDGLCPTTSGPVKPNPPIET